MDLLVAAILAAAALAALGVGFRGRRIDDHPLCRRCRFDLTGRPPGSDRCPECGRLLLDSRAIVIGHRRGQRGWLTLGAVALLLACACGGVGAISRIRQIQWIRYEPVSWLLRDADAAGPTSSAALVELQRRAAAALLSPAAYTLVVNHALAIQGDRTKHWQPAWGELIAAAARSRNLTASQSQRFFEQSITTVLTTKPTLRRGRFGMIEFRVIVDRFPRSAMLLGSYTGSGLHLDDPNQTVGGLSRRDFQDQPWPGQGSTLFASTLWSCDLAAGSPPKQIHSLFVDLTFNLSVPGLLAPPVQFFRRTACPVTVVDHDAIVDQFCVKSALRAEMASAMSGVVITATSDPHIWGTSTGTTVQLTLGATPMPVAADVVLQRDAQEQVIGPVSSNPNGGGQSVSVMTDQPLKFSGGFVDVVLRPAQDAADNRLTIQQFWGEPIVLHHVPCPTRPRA